MNVPSRQSPSTVPPPSGRAGQSRLVWFAPLAVAFTVAGSVIASLHAERSLFFSHAALIVIAAELAILALLQRRRVLHTVKAFFSAATHPLNLAVFRMAVFWAVFEEVRANRYFIPSFSRMPFALRFAPWGMGTLLPHLPIDVELARIATLLLLLFSVTGFIGLFSRTSALACAVLGFYVFGITQFFGKVDHDQHLLWFAAILAVSPCGDFFALDAIVTAWKRANRGIAEPFPTSRSYALPLRFVMLLMGIIYFFPGFWKLWQNGFDWFLSDNLPRQLYLFWTWSFDGLWLPAFRIDRHLWLCRIVAGATVLFELTFIFLMFSRTLRMAAAGAGLVFHAATNRFMRISFLSLRVCYVALFDWTLIFGFIGRWLVHEKLLFVYDGTSVWARRLVGFVRVWDIFDRVDYVDTDGKQALAGLPFALPEPRRNEPVPYVFAAVRNRRWTGFSAWCAFARRIPVLWPLLPIAWLRPAAERASSASGWLLAQRQLLPAAAPPMAGARKTQLACIAVVGCILLVGNITAGIGRHINAWPFACYPTFSLPPPVQIVALSVVAVGPGGRETVVRNFGFPYHRFYGLSRNLLANRDPVVQDQRMLLLWPRAVRRAPELRKATAVRFYEENLWIDPDRWSRNPAGRKLLFVWHPTPGGTVPQPRTKAVFPVLEWQ